MLEIFIKAYLTVLVIGLLIIVYETEKALK